MGGQTQQSNVAATALYDHPSNAGPVGDAGDAVMARWLQSAGLQHLASTGMDHRLLPNPFLMQGYGAQSMEEKQRLFKLMRNLNLNGESASDPYTPTAQSPGGLGSSDGFYSPEFRGDFGAGLLDLHSMDDTELLTEHVISEPFEVSPFMSGFNKAFDSDNDQQQKAQLEADAAAELSTIEKENNGRENNAKIKVVTVICSVMPTNAVLRKRAWLEFAYRTKSKCSIAPHLCMMLFEDQSYNRLLLGETLNKKEVARKEDDIVTVSENDCLTVHEPKLKVDLTAYVEKHEFCF
ncbi:hypothetical protein HAX54_029937 [Datura stramonium]|uniref:Uncharacterized protein n=1 Tax=Datura stramonium TaxID=4076 RepID=A0ABS8V9T1_DATST|nr:hypothetical protein [Datura stramonium]